VTYQRFMTTSLKDILELARKTGDTLIVAHADGTASVLMPLATYQKFIADTSAHANKKMAENSIYEGMILGKNRESTIALDNEGYYGTMAGLSGVSTAGMPREEKPEIPFEPEPEPQKEETLEDYFYIEPVQ